MKRLLFILLAAASIGATSGLPAAVRDVIEKALAGERDAVARYEAFAVKATEEGYLGAAALFRAQGRAEQVHAKRFAAILENHGLAVPPNHANAPRVGSTEDNLRAAGMAEAAERDGIYREAVDTCKLHAKTDIAKIFDQTRDSEVEHANLCVAASRDVSTMKAPKAYFVCDRCGYTTDVKLGFCPACQHKEALEKVQ